MADTNPQYVHYTKEDIFFGELGGCIEAIDVGTTTGIFTHRPIPLAPTKASQLWTTPI
jgi:hypothetical protein